jgi:uncharacterized protein
VTPSDFLHLEVAREWPPFVLGFLAVFDGPARAIRCALGVTTTVRELGLEVRAGAHTGECEVVGDSVAGLAVHRYARAVIPSVMAAVVLLAAFVKGAIGFGFPSLATPLLSLVVDVRTAVVVLILPNIVMDSIQFARRGAPLDTVRRFSTLLGAGAVGTMLGTRLLTLLSPRAATLTLGVFVLIFVTLNATGLAPKVPSHWEAWLSPVAGFVAGLVGGVTNSPATPLVLYFHGIGLSKHAFISAVAFAFFFYKLVQLGAVSWYGLLPLPLLWVSIGLTCVGLLGFAVGLKLQDRLDQRTFNRTVLVFLGALGAWLVLRGRG